MYPPQCPRFPTGNPTGWSACPQRTRRTHIRQQERYWSTGRNGPLLFHRHTLTSENIYTKMQVILHAHLPSHTHSRLREGNGGRIIYYIKIHVVVRCITCCSNTQTYIHKIARIHTSTQSTFLLNYHPHIYL
jgi:hypothetical protein